MVLKILTVSNWNGLVSRRSQSRLRRERALTRVPLRVPHPLPTMGEGMCVKLERWSAEPENLAANEKRRLPFRKPPRGWYALSGHEDSVDDVNDAVGLVHIVGGDVGHVTF